MRLREDRAGAGLRGGIFRFDGWGSLGQSNQHPWEVIMLANWLKFAHDLVVITRFLAHGAGAALAFRIRRETNLDRIRAMLDLSVTPFMAYMLAYLLLGILGIALLLYLKLWSRGWVWVSIVLTLGVFVWMYRLASPYRTLRKLVGLPYMEGNKQRPAEPPASDEEIAAHIGTLGVGQFVLAGYLVPAVVLWLMVFRPF